MGMCLIKRREGRVRARMDRWLVEHVIMYFIYTCCDLTMIPCLVSRTSLIKKEEMSQ